jgi:molecular chaperone HtpG
VSTPIVSLRRPAQEQQRPWNPVSGRITVGKDILELLSTSMYIDPMSIYREYVQNSADAIDDARETGILAGHMPGRIDFNIDLETRTVRIRDNGIGVPSADFVERLTAFGASRKRGRNSRGFRGVGRLAGVGYCQELLFRTRASGEKLVSEMRWDCRQLKHLMRAEDRHKHLRDLVLEAVTVRQLPSTGVPSHFFEVELRSIIRHKNDQLLDANAINAYLSQVGPVPFSPDFRFGPAINSALRSQIDLGEVEINLPGMDHPVYRPHRDHVELGGKNKDACTELEIISIPGMDGETAAIGWVLHHGYTGALPTQTLQKGLRLRVGNIQVGDHRLLDDLFPEPRFNGWCIGEVHIADSRIVPNGRRDNFEQNTHYLNLLTHLTLGARGLTKRCRTSSMRRNRWREFLREIEIAKEKLAIVQQGALGRTERARLLREVHAAIAEAKRVAQGELFAPPEDAQPERELQKLAREVAKVTGENGAPSPLAHLSRVHRQAYQQVFSLIYECAPNRSVAKAIVDRIITRL